MRRVFPRRASAMPRLGLPALLVAGALVAAAPAFAEEAAPLPVPPKQSWSFAGPFGRFDQAQLQRGYQVYREVCSSCHSMKFVSFRNLAEAGGPGFSESQVKALSESFKVQDGPNDAGDMFERPGRPSDPFPAPFPNEQAARAANGGALPPDMSVLAKARDIEFGGLWFLVQPFSQYSEQGIDYIHALLNGYKEKPPEGYNLPAGKYYNDYYPGHAISMPKPLNDGQVAYTDGSPQTVEQYSHDIAAFLTWAAEPKLVERKRTGLTVVIFLAVFLGLLYQIKKRIWAGISEETGGNVAPAE